MDPLIAPDDGRSERDNEETERKDRAAADRTIKRRPLRILIRCCLSIGFSIAGSFLFSFLLGLVALAIGNFSASASVSVSSTCKILSTGVDLRSSRVCELGLLNYKARHVFYPSERRRFRCHDDYYWASVFQVEYKEYFSGQTLQAVAEAPKEALPVACRPDFGSALLTRSLFKVNETYSCRYTLGSWKPDIYYSDGDLFNCQAKDPSITEIIKRLSVLLVQSSTYENMKLEQTVRYAFAGALSGVVGGMLATLFGAAFVKSINGFWLALPNKHCARAFAKWLRRVCLLIAYLSAVIWLTLQYGKIVGLRQLLLDSKLIERIW